MRNLLIAGLAILLISCELIPTDPNNPDNKTAEPFGTLVADFPVTHSWLPTSKIIRTDLHIAVNAYEMYKGKYLQSANVTDTQQKYTFYLAPGTYYLEAAIACLCEGDSCSAGGFPGNKWGQKHATYTFTVEEDKTTEVMIRFLQ